MGRVWRRPRPARPSVQCGGGRERQCLRGGFKQQPHPEVPLVGGSYGRDRGRLSSAVGGRMRESPSWLSRADAEVDGAAKRLLGLAAITVNALTRATHWIALASRRVPVWVWAVYSLGALL